MMEKTIGKNTVSETRLLFSVALPMIVSQASDTVMLFADRLFLSRLGKLHIAASMSGGLTYFVYAAFFIGIAGYVNAIAAQYFGAGRKEECSRSAAQAIYICFFSIPFLLLLVPVTRLFFSSVGHGPEQVELEFTYFRILMMGGVFTLLRNALGGFFIGIGRTRVVMLSNVIGMVVNIPFNYIFIFGKLGFPAMGIQGAAFGTIAGAATTVILLFIFYLSPSLRKEFGTHRNWRFDKRLSGKLLRFGFPAGAEMFLNMMAFNIFLQLMHSYGPDVAASVTIAFNWDLVAFIPMIGMSVATTSLVGRHIGQGDYSGARSITYMALRYAYIYAGVMMCLFIFNTRPLVTMFTRGFTGGEADVVPLAVTMLRLAAVYTLADATQLVFAGALRGAGDTRWVMWISVLIHWSLAVTSFLLIRYVNISPVTMWTVFIGFILSMGTAMFLRFRSPRWESIHLIENPVSR